MKHRFTTITVIFIAAILFMVQSTQAGSLHNAIWAGDLQKVKQLLNQGADVNAKDMFQATPLHDAAVAGKTDMAELLIREGADVNAKDEFQKIPLHYAANAEVADLLIRRGADVNARDDDQETPLYWAAEKGKTKVAALLIRKGADVNARNKHQQTPLHEAARGGKTEMAELLIKAGADVNAGNEYQQTPLHDVVNAEVAELLIRKGADVNAKDKFQQTPLHDVENAEVAELLISKGADTNAKDNDQNTPLHLAAQNGKTKVAELLIRKGVDVNAGNRSGKTAAVLAEEHNHSELASLIRTFSGGSARSDLDELVRKVVNDGGALMEGDISLAVRLARSVSPPPAIPQEAKEEMAKGNAAFKLANQPDDFDKAVEHFRKAARHAPWWPAPYYNIAMVQEKQREFLLAKVYYKDYLLAAPDAADAQAVKEKIAEMDLRMKRAEQVKKLLEQAHQYYDNQFYNKKAHKDYSQAIEEARKAVRLDPDNVKSHAFLGQILARSDKSHAKEAITELEYARRLGTKRRIFWDLAFAYDKLDDYDAAITNYKKSLARVFFDDAQKATLHSNIGFDYEKKGDSESALNHFEQALNLGYSGRSDIKAEIRKLKRQLGR